MNKIKIEDGGNYCEKTEARPEIALNVDMLMIDVFDEWITDKMIFDLLDAMTAAPQTFQVLTKWPERMAHLLAKWKYTRKQILFPANIWLGISAEDQIGLDERLVHLIRSEARVIFLSLEPLLGSIDLGSIDIDWVIIGGESGPGARPMDLAWLEDILRQCSAANIPAFVKQLGSHWAGATRANHAKGGDPAEWPPEFRVRMFPGETWR